MEDVLAVYTRPRDPDYPLVCLDETSKQLLAETRLPIPMKPGRPARCDYEYERNGTANLFMMFAPLEGWRHVKVTDRSMVLRDGDWLGVPLFFLSALLVRLSKSLTYKLMVGHSGARSERCAAARSDDNSFWR